MTNEKSYNCPSTIPASQFGRVLTKGWSNQPTKSCDHLIMWSPEKLKNLYLHFNNTYGRQNVAEQRLRVGTTIPQVMWTFNQVVSGHYLLSFFKASVAIILKILSLLSVVLRFLDDETTLMLSYLTCKSSPP